MPTNDLVDFMAAESNRLAGEYKRIQKRACEDPGTAGDQGEENWAALMRHWLPPSYHVVTKGRIMNHKGETSPQVDVIVLTPAYPKALWDSKTYLAGGVIAAFECKVTLKSQHVAKAVQTAAKISKLFFPREGEVYEELHSPIFYGLLAHSHALGQRSVVAEAALEQKLVEADKRYVAHPRQMLELVCVSDLGTWIGCRILMSSIQRSGANNVEPGRIESSYFAHTSQHSPRDVKFTPIGAFLTGLYRKMAREDSSLGRLSEYLRESGIHGSARAPRGRTWESDVFSEELRPRIERSLQSSERPWMYMYS